MKRLLYVPSMVIPSMEAPLGTLKCSDEDKFARLYQQYNVLWDTFSLAVSRFAEQYKVNRIFVNSLSPYRFKEDIRLEIEEQSHLGRCIDSLLQGDTTIELLENPDWWNVENMLINEGKQLSSQLLEYFRKYLDMHKKNGSYANCLTDFENKVNLYTENSLVDEWQFPIISRSEKQQTVTKQLIPTFALNPNLMADIKGESSARLLAKTIKDGDSCVAFLHAAETPLYAFRALLPDIKLHHYPHLNSRVIEFLQQIVSDESIPLFS